MIILSPSQGLLGIADYQIFFKKQHVSLTFHHSRNICLAVQVSRSYPEGPEATVSMGVPSMFGEEMFMASFCFLQCRHRDRYLTAALPHESALPHAACICKHVPFFLHGS